VRYVEAGVDGRTAVFAVGPSGTLYAVDGFAQSFSSLPTLRIMGTWGKEIDWVKGCLASM
jgi:hypothetical protein